MTDLAFELPNAGPGPDPFSPTGADADFLVVLFQCDYYSSNCRQQVKALRRRYEAFRERDAVVAAVLPEPRERAADWQSQYDLPFPILADPDAAVADRYDQPVRFGVLGRLHDVIGRMPMAAVLDLRGAEPELVFAYRGSSSSDRPTVDDLLSELDQVAAAPVAGGAPGGDGDVGVSAGSDGGESAGSTAGESTPDGESTEATADDDIDAATADEETSADGKEMADDGLDDDGVERNEGMVSDEADEDDDDGDVDDAVNDDTDSTTATEEANPTDDRDADDEGP